MKLEPARGNGIARNWKGSSLFISARGSGAVQFYFMCGDEGDTLEKYKKEVLPAFL
jgi:hypothetical protein